MWGLSRRNQFVVLASATISLVYLLHREYSGEPPAARTVQALNSELRELPPPHGAVTHECSATHAPGKAMVRCEYAIEGRNISIDDYYARMLSAHGWMPCSPSTVPREASLRYCKGEWLGVVEVKKAPTSQMFGVALSWGLPL